MARYNVTRDGEVISIDSSELDKANQLGWELTPESRDMVEYGEGVVPTTIASGLGLLRGYTGGFSDPLVAALPGITGEDISKYERYNPQASAVSEGLGIGASFLPGVGWVGKGTQLTGRAVGALTRGAIKSGLAKGALTAAAEGALYGMGAQASEATRNESEEFFSEGLGKNMAIGALASAGLFGAGKAVGKGIRVARGTAAKAIGQIPAQEIPEASQKAAEKLDNLAEALSQKVKSHANDRVAMAALGAVGIDREFYNSLPKKKQLEYMREALSRDIVIDGVKQDPLVWWTKDIQDIYKNIEKRLKPIGEKLNKKKTEIADLGKSHPNIATDITRDFLDKIDSKIAAQARNDLTLTMKYRGQKALKDASPFLDKIKEYLGREEEVLTRYRPGTPGEYKLLRRGSRPAVELGQDIVTRVYGGQEKRYIRDASGKLVELTDEMLEAMTPTDIGIKDFFDFRTSLQHIFEGKNAAEVVPHEKALRHVYGLVNESLNDYVQRIGSASGKRQLYNEYRHINDWYARLADMLPAAKGAPMGSSSMFATTPKGMALSWLWKSIRSRGRAISAKSLEALTPEGEAWKTADRIRKSMKEFVAEKAPRWQKAIEGVGEAVAGDGGKKAPTGMRAPARVAITRAALKAADINEASEAADRLATIAVHPAAISEQLADDPRLYDVTNRQAELAMQSSQRAIQFLQQRLPEGSSPTREQLRTFAKYYRAVKDPTTVLTELSAGTITPEAAEAFRMVYPAMFNVAVRNLFELLAERGIEARDLPYQKRVALSVFLGQPFDDSFKQQSLAAIQSSYMRGQQQQATGAQAAQQGARGNLAADKSTRSMSPSQAVQARY